MALWSHRVLTLCWQVGAETEDMKRVLGWRSQPSHLNVVMWTHLIAQEVGRKLQLCVRVSGSEFREQLHCLCSAAKASSFAFIVR